MKGRTDIFPLAEQCNKTMSRATSGRLRLNDEILSGEAMFTKLHYTFLRGHYRFSTESSISQKYLFVKVISCPSYIYDDSFVQSCIASSIAFLSLCFVSQESFSLAKRIYLSYLYELVETNADLYAWR